MARECGQAGVPASEDPVRITTIYRSSEPGCERQFDAASAAVTLSVRVSSLGLDADGEARLRVLARTGCFALTPTTAAAATTPPARITLTVGDFPFQAQNRKRALEILQELVSTCQSPGLFAPASEPQARAAAHARRPSLHFPTHWLPAARAAQ